MRKVEPEPVFRNPYDPLNRNCRHGWRAQRRLSYVLLETVIATGLLIVGLAVIGAQVQDSVTTIKKMELRTRALMLSQQHLAELDLGLIELDSVDEMEEGDFGPRYPDWGWRIITEETAIDGMYLLQLEVLHELREGDYREDDFEYDDAEIIHTAYAYRATPQAIDFAADFGLQEDEVAELSEKLASLSIPGLDAFEFDPALLAKLDFEEVLETLPLVLSAFGISLDQLTAALPPGVLDQIKESGLLGEQESEAEEGLGQGTGSGDGG